MEMPAPKTWMIIALVAACGAGGFGFAFMRKAHPDVAAIRVTLSANFSAQCFKSARATAPAGVADDTLRGFCGCTASRLNTALTDDDVEWLAEQERLGVTAPPALLMDKARPIAATCRAEAGLAG